MKDEVLVSVCVVTYNHEKFIRECLDSILSQKTNFRFNVLVSDDCSNDDTLSILNEYSSRFQNVHVKSRCGMPKSIYNGKPTGNRNGVENLNRANGTYVAICDGDDRWDDQNKLQKQVDILSKKSDLALICTSKKVLKNGEITSPKFRLPNLSFSYKILCFYNPLPASSVLFKKELYKEPGNWIFDLPIGDWPIWFEVCKGKRILKLSEPSLTYRVHSEGAWGGMKKSSKAFSSLLTVKTLMEKNSEIELRISYILHSVRYWFFYLLEKIS